MAPPRPAAPVSVVRAFPLLQLDQPVSLAATPDHAWWFVAERRGRVWRIAAADEHAAAAELVLDISDRVNASTAAIGLLAITLHPSFATNGTLFVSYTGHGGTVATSRIARFVSHDGGRTFDRSEEEPVLELDQISDYHVNTDLEFGSDGYLYAGFGDGGPQGDPHMRAQDPFSLKGKILRLDVDKRRPYAIPADNPFASGGGAPEVWALGLRNPWRFAFDRETGELWLGDVGEDRIEEIDRVVRGGNYGWSVREGTRCTRAAGCQGLDTIDPVVAIEHPEVSSITFGVAYRGSAIPALRGHLIYGDYASGVIWAVDPTRSTPPRMINNDGHAVVAFAEDANGEPLLVDIAGTLWRIVPGADGPSDVPQLLSQTGCFQRGGTAKTGLIPYDINVPFWSDGSAKRRWFAIPDGTKIGIRSQGRLELPIGSVIAKEFSIGDLRIETRLFVRHDDGNWAGYTYQWDASQSDARLVPAQARGTMSAWPKPWYFPHRGECSRCHQAAAGYALGLELAQLDRRIGSYDQLATFERIGLFADPVPAVQPLPPKDASIEQRARAWLHTNCAFCHRPGATGQGNMDLRFTTPLANMRVCDVPPQLDNLSTRDARLIAPGDPMRSILWRRMRTLSFPRMPPVGTIAVDNEGVALVESWIKQLTCDRKADH